MLSAKRFMVFVAAALLVTVLCPPIGGMGDAGAKGVPVGKGFGPENAVRAEVEHFRAESDGGWTVWRSDRSGLIRRIASSMPGAHLSAFAGKNLSTKETAAAFLDEIAGLLGINPILSEMEICLVKRGLAAEHVVFRRVIGGVPVEPGRVGIHLDRNGRLLYADGTVDPRLLSDGIPGKSEARVERENAFEAATMGALGVGAVSRTEMIYMENEGSLRLCWLVRYTALDPMGDWEVRIDALTGEEIDRVDRTLYATGKGRIWSPNPVNALMTYDLYDMNDQDQTVFDDAYIIVDLPGLDEPIGGKYYLNGPYVRIEDFEPDYPGDPVLNYIPSVSHPDSFMTTRSDSLFEAVMVYYHIDNSQRYVRSLGFDGVSADTIVNGAVHADPHGLSGDDNSHYISFSHQIAFGDGGVDDAEEADVIVHEYGHTLEYGQVPNWGYPSGYMGAMAEGFSDYWAESYAARRGVTFDIGQVFDWDKGPMDNFWLGRRVDNNKTMDDLVILSGGNIYRNSQIYSGALWDILMAIDRVDSDRAILEGHFYLNGTSPLSTFEEGAYGILQADRALTGWENGLEIFDAFAGRGIFDEDVPEPVMLYAAHPETLYSGGELPCTLTVSTNYPVRSVNVVFGITVAEGDTVTLENSGDTLFTGSLNLPAVESVRYFYRLLDPLGRAQVLPYGAPGSAYKIVLGEDLIPPVIIHTPLTDLYDSELPAVVTADVTDNFSVNHDSVYVEYGLGGGTLPDPCSTFALSRVGDTSEYTGSFPEVSDTILYRIVAVDASLEGNRSVDPPTGYYSFAIYPATVRLNISGPNPFRETTGFTLITSNAAVATFRIYDVSGRLVKTILDGHLEPGAHELSWDGRTGDDRTAAPGVYFYRVETSGYEKTGRIVFLR